MQKRTQKEYKIFKEEVEYWVDYFKLYNWYIRVLFAEDKDIIESTMYLDDGERDAWSMINHKDHMAIIYLNKKILCEKELSNDYELRMVAFHEVCEVLLFPITILAEDTYSSNVIIKNTHIIINHLENSVFKEKYGNLRRDVDKT